MQMPEPDARVLTRKAEIVARLRADAPISAGQTARLAFNLDKAVLFDPQTQERIG